MAWATVIKKASGVGSRPRRPASAIKDADPAAAAPRGRLGRRLSWRRAGYWGGFSLTRRVLAVNLVVVALLGGGMLYLDRYERGLTQTELQALKTQGGIFAAALGEGAVLQAFGEEPVLVPSLAESMTRRLVEPARIRARLFLADGDLIADSRTMDERYGGIEVEALPPPGETGGGIFKGIFDKALDLLRDHQYHTPYIEHAHQQASDYEEVMRALDGHTAEMVRTDPSKADGDFVLSVAVPVRRYKLVLGAVMLSVGSSEVEQQVEVVRADIVRLFGAALVMTVLLSLYLAGTIARPVRRLAQAAHAVSQDNGRKVRIPDFSRRRDEIGELSVALSDMTDAIWQRMDAIERFAADVAHEIKNPLSSLRSAVETAARVQDPALLSRLMGIIVDDVKRLDRLITDISDASRLDAEMSRLERQPVDLAGMFSMLQQIHETTRDETGPRLSCDLPQGVDKVVVPGKEGRLVQVFRNLIGNAVSFSPPDGEIRLRIRQERREIVATVEDEGPGIPEGKLSAIFDRFYTERPAGEKFGTHSGLGLSISKQIVEAHGGCIVAENRLDAAGRVSGARFVVRLPTV
jgi:two-component system sensor histidine kinase ChvG